MTGLHRFEFNAPRLVFGAGVISELPSLAGSVGARALVVTGANQSRAQQHLQSMCCQYFSVPSEPTVPLIREGVALARAFRADYVVGFGGGSAIDAAKAIAAIVPNSGDPMRYLEVVGEARPLETAPLPWIAIPTTAGTGAEVTRNAVIGSPEHAVKASIRSPLMLARIALVDPALTLEVAPSITASTGLDAITQLIEPFVSIRANALTDLYCVDGLRRAITALPRAYANGADLAARCDMSFASMLSGLCLANAGLGAVHGFAAPLGGMLNAPHGALCAAVLPHATAINIRALRARVPDSPSLAKYSQIAELLTGERHAEACIGALATLSKQLNIPSLRTFGLTPADFAITVERAAAASSMKANPLPLSAAELTEILELAF